MRKGGSYAAFGGSSSFDRSSGFGGAGPREGPATLKVGSGITVPTDFVKFCRNLRDAISVGRVKEILDLYESERRQLTAAHFASSNWPGVKAAIGSLRSTAPFLGALVPGGISEKTFGLLYSLLRLKHELLVKSGGEASLETMRGAFGTYSTFLEFVVSEECVGLVLPPEWVYDVLNEYVYICQLFHERRSALHLAGEKTGEGEEWSIPVVLSTLRRVSRVSGVEERLRSGDGGVGRGSEVSLQAGYFAFACYIRLQTKLCDYGASCEAAALIHTAQEAPFARVNSCHLTLSHYVAFSLVMARRYDDAARVLSRVLLFNQRRLRLLSDSSDVSPFTRRIAERMLALLALCMLLSPGAPVDEQVARKVRREYDSRMATILSTRDSSSSSSSRHKKPDADAPPTDDSEAEDALATLRAMYVLASPSFLVPSFPPKGPDAADRVHKQQAALFLDDAIHRTSKLPAVRSYLRLYSAAQVPKLAAFAGVPTEDMHTLLTALKHTTWQRQGGVERPASNGPFAAIDNTHFVVYNDKVRIWEGDADAPRAASYLARKIGEVAAIRDAPMPTPDTA